MAKKKTPQETPPVTMRKPRTGKGLLKVGNPGNEGGTGRPPSVIRARMRGSLYDRLKIAEAIADSATASDSDRLRALDFLAKYGLGTRQEVTGEDGAPMQLEHITVTRRIVHPDGDA